MHISLVSISVTKYMVARFESCLTMPKQPCMDCTRMLQVAQAVAKHGHMSLSEAFNIISPGIKYSAESTRGKLLDNHEVAVHMSHTVGVAHRHYQLKRGREQATHTHRMIKTLSSGRQEG